jgi:DNA-binding NarL/FixJ family response regulator
MEAIKGLSKVLWAARSVSPAADEDGEIRKGYLVMGDRAHAPRDDAHQVALQPPSVKLTPRQRQVLELVRLGYTNAEIGVALGIATRTVRLHTDALKRKLSVDSRRRLHAVAGQE